MIKYLKNSGEFKNFSEKERHEVLNMNEAQLAELAFLTSVFFAKDSTYSSFNKHSLRKKPINPTIRACLATAIGIGAIRDLILNTAALGTV